MTVLEFIDLDNKDHLREVKKVFDTGVWTPDFYDKYLVNLEFENNWMVTLSFKLAKRYINTTLGE
jgi:hypothetical protein